MNIIYEDMDILYVYINVNYVCSIDHYNFGGSHASDIITCFNGNAHLFGKINVLPLIKILQSKFRSAGHLIIMNIKINETKRHLKIEGKPC